MPPKIVFYLELLLTAGIGTMEGSLRLVHLDLMSFKNILISTNFRTMFTYKRPFPSDYSRIPCLLIRTSWSRCGYALSTIMFLQFVIVEVLDVFKGLSAHLALELSRMRVCISYVYFKVIMRRTFYLALWAHRLASLDDDHLVSFNAAREIFPAKEYL
jgi:hypothetical protein